MRVKTLFIWIACCAAGACSSQTTPGSDVGERNSRQDSGSTAEAAATEDAAADGHERSTNNWTSHPPCTNQAECPDQIPCLIGYCVSDLSLTPCEPATCYTHQACMQNLSEHCDGCTNDSGCVDFETCTTLLGNNDSDCVRGTRERSQPDVGRAETGLQDASFEDIGGGA